MGSKLGRLLPVGLLAVAALVGLAVLTGDEVVAQVRAALVKNVDEPWRTPWETRSQFLPNAGGCFGTSDCFNYADGPQFAVFDLRPVPAGKRWVVQSATGMLVNGVGRTNQIEIGYPRGSFVFDGTKWGFAGPYSAGVSFDSAIFHTSLNISFGPGEAPFVKVVADPSLSGYSVLVFSGYLIDAN